MGLMDMLVVTGWLGVCMRRDSVRRLFLLQIWEPLALKPKFSSDEIKQDSVSLADYLLK